MTGFCFYFNDLYQTSAACNQSCSGTVYVSCKLILVLMHGNQDVRSFCSSLLYSFKAVAVGSLHAKNSEINYNKTMMFKRKLLKLLFFTFLLSLTVNLSGGQEEDGKQV